jgi:O-antigen/teichoic acid export membrane protein
LGANRASARRPIAVLAVSHARAALHVGSRFRRNVVMTAMVGLSVYGLGLLTGPILARSLGPAGRGELAAVLVPAELLCFGLSFGLPTAAAYLAGDYDHGTLLATSLVFGLVVGVPLVLGVWPLLPHYYAHHEPATLFWAYVFLGTAPLSVGAGAAFNLLWADGAGLRWNLWRVAPTVVTAVLTVGLFLSARLTVWTALAAAFVGSFSTAALLVQTVVRCRRLRVRLDALRRQLSYGMRVVIGSLAETMTARLDQALLVVMVPPAELGLYAVAVTATLVSAPLASSLGFALFPELRRDDLTEVQRQRTGRALAAVLISSTAVATILAVFGPWLLERLFGPAFALASTPLRLLLLGQIANDATHPLAARLLAANRPGAASRASVIAAVITVTGLVLLVPTFGINGAAVTTTVSYLARFGFAAIAVRRVDVHEDQQPRQPGTPNAGGDSNVGRNRS